MRIPNPSPEAIQLFHEGTLVLSEIENTGIAVDEPYLDRAIAETSERIQLLESELMEDEVWKVWKKKFKDRANIDSGDQLGKVIFGEMGFPCTSVTEKTGQYKTDESAFADIDLPFVKKLFKCKKQKKALSTYLQPIKEEIYDGLVHPFFHLAGGHQDDKGGARSFRSSSSSINLQNVPVRNPELAAILRKVFIARPGHHFVEIDMSGAEVRVGACYHKDPNMIRYINDPTTDMHRDMASQIYGIPATEVSKTARYCAKNQFVFAEFYGSYFKQCAPPLWENIRRMKLTTNGGESLYEVLKQKGITKLGDCDHNGNSCPGTFEYHLKQVEQDFWGKRFKVYAEWKDQWWRKFLERGWFKNKIGFVFTGQVKMTKNDVMNYPIQSASFHCLLWILIQLQKWIKKNNLKTLLVGEVHDSIIGSVPPDELNDVVQKVVSLIKEDLPSLWKWIIVPLEVEAEASPINGSWYDKKPIKL